MSTDLFKEALYNDGEGVTHGDLNDSQRFLSAQLWDQTLAQLIGGIGLTSVDYDVAANGVTPPDHLAYCLQGGAGFPYLGSTTNKIKMMPGTLLQRVGAATGDERVMLAYTFAGTEEFTIAAGDATNPRVDLLQMKLELVNADSQSRDFEDAATGVITTTSQMKKRRVQCTISVKTGTPAASPTYPDPDAGYVAIGGVVVGANYLTTTQIIFGVDTAGANAVLHDQRMPLNVQGYRTPVSSFHIVASVTRADPAYFATSTSTTLSHLRIPCLKAGSAGRIVGIDVAYSSTTALTAALIRAANADQDLSTLTLPLNAGLTFYTRGFVTFEGAHAPTAGPVVQQSAVNKIGPPIWTNGRRCLIQRQYLGVTERDTPMLKIQGLSNAGFIADATWYVAQGM